jgi:hypothetical protein
MCWPALRRVALAAPGRRVAEHRRDVPAELEHHHDREKRRAGHEERGLDDLHPGRALHAADDDVEDHQGADREDREVLRRAARDAEKQGHQRTGTDHLRDQVEDRDGDGRDAGCHAYGALAHAEGQHVGHRVLARVAQQLGDEQERDEPGDEEADGVQEAVVAVERDDAGDAEEGRRRHVVAADGDAVLRAAERATAGVVVGSRLGLPAGPDRDDEGRRDERREQRNRQRALAARDLLGGDRELRGACVGAHRMPSRSMSLRILSAIGSRFLLAWRQ